MSKYLFLAPATDRGEAYSIFSKTVCEGVPRELYINYTDSSYGEKARIWGLGKSYESRLNDLESGDWLLFYTEANQYTFAACVRGVEMNSELGEAVRSDFLTHTVDNRAWDILLFLEEPISISISGHTIANLFNYSNYYPSRFIRVPEERLESIIDKYGDIDEFIAAIRQ